VNFVITFLKNFPYKFHISANNFYNSYIQSFLKICQFAIQHKNQDDFHLTYGIICKKCLSLISKIVELNPAKSIFYDNLIILLDLISFEDSNHFSIYQAFLILYTLIIKNTESISNILENILLLVKQNILSYIPIFTFQPFSQNKKTQLLLDYFSSVVCKYPSEFQYLSSICPLVETLKFNPSLIQSITKMIQSMINFELTSGHKFSLEILFHITSCMEILREELDNDFQPVLNDSFIESNIQLIILFWTCCST
jgi:hypothetical protein